MLLGTVEPNCDQFRGGVRNRTELAVERVDFFHAKVLQTFEIIADLLGCVDRVRGLFAIEFSTMSKMDKAVLKLFGYDHRVGRLLLDARADERKSGSKRLWNRRQGVNSIGGQLRNPRQAAQAPKRLSRSIVIKSVFSHSRWRNKDAQHAR